ncbi:hypothetical protein P154DRAFT_449259, partial [Amniculicola lignicola CBS 123094]
PIPPNKPFYFEVTILNQGDDQSIGVGFGAQSAGLSSRPGMNEDTWGYHSEDGGIFNYPVGTTSYTNGTFGTGDVIGCCVDPTLGTAYFTKNNEKLDEGFAGIKGRVFPMVGLACAGSEVRVNFSSKQAPYNANQGISDEELFDEDVAEPVFLLPDSSD